MAGICPRPFRDSVSPCVPRYSHPMFSRPARCGVPESGKRLRGECRGGVSPFCWGVGYPHIFPFSRGGEGKKRTFEKFCPAKMAYCIPGELRVQYCKQAASDEDSTTKQESRGKKIGHDRHN